MYRIVFTLCLLIALTTGIKAQVTLDTAAYPHIGDTMFYSKADTVGHTPGAAGSSVTWNFAALNPNGNYLRAEGKAPGTVAVSGGTVPASATIALADDGGGYRFQKVMNAGAYIVGEKSRLGTIVNYSDSAQIFSFPFAFSNSVTDSLYGLYGDGFGLTNFNRKGEVTTTYDGTGTLTTPYSTYNNAARIHRHWVIFDTATAAAVSGNLIFDEYEWYVSTSHLPVMRYTIENLTINSGGVPGTPSVTINIMYESTPPVGRNEELVVSSFSLFPNPAGTHATIRFTLDKNQACSYRLLDLNGKVMHESEEFNPGIGNHDLSINLDGVAKGVYLLNFSGGEQQQNHKLIVR